MQVVPSVGPSPCELCLLSQPPAQDPRLCSPPAAPHEGWHEDGALRTWVRQSFCYWRTGAGAAGGNTPQSKRFPRAVYSPLLPLVLQSDQLAMLGLKRLPHEKTPETSASGRCRPCGAALLSMAGATGTALTGASTSPFQIPLLQLPFN